MRAHQHGADQRFRIGKRLIAFLRHDNRIDSAPVPRKAFIGDSPSAAAQCAPQLLRRHVGLQNQSGAPQAIFGIFKNARDRFSAHARDHGDVYPGMQRQRAAAHAKIRVIRKSQHGDQPARLFQRRG